MHLLYEANPLLSIEYVYYLVDRTVVEGRCPQIIHVAEEPSAGAADSASAGAPAAAPADNQGMLCTGKS